MGNGIPLYLPRLRSLQVQEAALAALGTGACLVLLLAKPCNYAVLLEVIGATAIYLSVLYAGLSKAGVMAERVRFAASFVFVLWFYCAVARIIPALRTTLQDSNLLGIDERLFGRTPAVACERLAAAWLTDLLSLCYLTYHVYLAIAVIQAIRDVGSVTGKLSAYLFTSFAIGFTGYLLVPAVGPEFAFPDLFQSQLPGSIVSRVIRKVVAQGSSGYDVFPSLHVMITCVLLDHDWRHLRRRFWVMVVPALGLVISTIYLRYHYGVDVLVGLGLFFLLRTIFLSVWNRKASPMP